MSTPVAESRVTRSSGPNQSTACHITVDLRSRHDFWRPSHAHTVLLKRAFPCIEWGFEGDGDTASFDPSRTDILVAWRVSEGDLRRFTSLKWIITPVAGPDCMPFSALAKAGVSLSRLAGIHRTPMATHIMSLILAISRDLFTSYSLQRTKEWWNDDLAKTFFDLDGETMMIFGCGEIGTELARLAEAFRMKVIGVRRNLPQSCLESSSIRWCRPESTPEHLQKCRIVVDVLPKNPTTLGYFSKAVFDLMAPGTVFINAGRASTVVVDDLLSAIDSGVISWCGLDVFDPKPPPLDSPLRAHPRIVLTPKMGAFHRKYMDIAVDAMIGHIQTFILSGTIPHSVVVNDTSKLRVLRDAISQHSR